MILGVDEAGRGPWAGPLAVGAVVLGGAEIEGLTDSKKLTKKRREALNLIIRDKASAVAVGFVESHDIDRIGLSESLKLATIRAVEQIKVPYHEIIIDGTINFLKDTGKGQFVTTMAKADLLVPSVSAASIVAKVARDKLMEQYDEEYPGYGFGSHSGYGTAAHRLAIERLGVTPIHRLSFAPLQKYATPDDASLPTQDIKSMSITSKKIGDVAEDEAANYLVRLGHEILDRNWKTRYCEIDIVSLHDQTVYFTEVKYRRSAKHGDGFAAITSKKLRQMKFAAEYYAQKQRINSSDLRLAAISVTGDTVSVDGFLEIQ